ncbi:hypothetical protein TRIATDRAFT_301115 [Trichoderma atroviride IMI 206040]|uniref:Uncharacterized protein n=1 Tax=Hypocrea atroviridis (strain ATCC 20476 / IMI 206040) TaxID=452589 RepID=G9P0Q8_HYPAI|nr:uncharacterized protein TRIATDRAFT_301115 [Trichoderma atroviride IMI 206040]EHK43209.1 hypothetical protein TRIATDRAFT_301115 [Trichoderma atroviride IMI 206040]
MLQTGRTTNMERKTPTIKVRDAQSTPSAIPDLCTMPSANTLLNSLVLKTFDRQPSPLRTRLSSFYSTPPFDVV